VSSFDYYRKFIITILFHKKLCYGRVTARRAMSLEILFLVLNIRLTIYEKGQYMPPDAFLAFNFT